MSAIIDFFSSIIDILVSVISLLITLVKSIVWLVTNLPQLIAGVTSGFGFAPSFILPFLLCSLAALVVIFLIKLL